MTARQATKAAPFSPDFLRDHCDGSGPHSGPQEVRVYPLGAGGNLILCQRCFAHENRYRFERGRETGAPENWPQVNYFTAKVYATEEVETP